MLKILLMRENLSSGIFPLSKFYWFRAV